MDKHVLVVGGGHGYYEPFSKYGKYTSDENILSEPYRISLVLFTGGADVSPHVYNEDTCHETFCSPERDIHEIRIFRNARKKNLPLVGVCRGAQLLCVLSGGRLYQHVTGHHTWHPIKTCDDQIMQVSSTHHQMMRPRPDAKIIAWATPHLSRYYMAGNNEEQPQPAKEVEVAYFPNIHAVGMQYHPEMMPRNSLGFIYASRFVDEHLKILPTLHNDEQFT